MEYLDEGGTNSEVEFGRRPSRGCRSCDGKSRARRSDRAVGLRKVFPFEAAAWSDGLGWVGLEAARCRAASAFECSALAPTHHRLVLFTRPPDEFDLRREAVKRNVPPPAGSISLMPAGSTARVRSSGWKDKPHIFLDAVWSRVSVPRHSTSIRRG